MSNLRFRWPMVCLGLLGMVVLFAACGRDPEKRLADSQWKFVNFAPLPGMEEVRAQLQANQDVLDTMQVRKRDENGRPLGPEVIENQRMRLEQLRAQNMDQLETLDQTMRQFINMGAILKFGPDSLVLMQVMDFTDSLRWMHPNLMMQGSELPAFVIQPFVHPDTLQLEVRQRVGQPLGVYLLVRGKP